MDFSIINTAIAATPQPTHVGSPETMSTILLLVGFIVIFYFLLWRPQSKRAKEHRELISKLQIGDEVITSAGMLGRIVKVSDDFVVVALASNVEIKMQKSAIVATVPKGTAESI